VNAMKMDYFIIYGRTVIVRMLVSTQERCIDIIGLLSRGERKCYHENMAHPKVRLPQ